MERDGVAQIIAALEVIHQPRSSNDQRHEAQSFLEGLKTKDDAPYWGWQLALSTNGNDNIVRHFGLTLLQHAISYNYAQYSEEKRRAIRQWVAELAYGVTGSDPHFIKEKISSQWVAIAKRVWGNTESREYIGTDGWPEMDQALYELWNKDQYTRELTLSVFRTLFEDLFVLDDQIAAKRSSSLAVLCAEVVTSEHILTEAYSKRDEALEKYKYGYEGWLHRWAMLLRECFNNIHNPDSRKFAQNILETFRVCLWWVVPDAIRSEDILSLLSVGMELDDVQMAHLSTESLHVLVSRNFPNDEDYHAIIGSVFQPAGIAALSRVYDRAKDCLGDEQRYSMLKKLVEMVVGIGENLHAKARLGKDADYAGYYRLVLRTTDHPSLVISGFSMQFWVSVLRVDKILGREQADELLPEILRTGASRCIRFDELSEEHVSKQYLAMDYDSVPEMQSFLGNYRKFIEDIVRLSVCHFPKQGLTMLKADLEQFMSTPAGIESMNSDFEVRNENTSYFEAYSHFLKLDAALKGAYRWRAWYLELDKDEQHQEIMVIVEELCQKMSGMEIKDPTLKRRMVQTIVQFAPLLRGRGQLMLMVLERVFTACTTSYPENCSEEYRERIRELRSSCGTELNRLAYMCPMDLMAIYDDLERVIGETISSKDLSEYEIVAVKSFLLVISQRSQMTNREEKFAKIVDPVLQSWSDPETMKGLADLQWFMARVGIVRIAEYFRSRGVTADTDLLEAKMDEQGRNLKAELKASWAAIFPIRPTRVFIQYTIEKVDHHSNEYKDLINLWKPRIQPILPHVLQLTAQIAAYHNPQKWVDLPPEVQSFLKCSTQERFWQIGVSTKTRDQFLEDSEQASHTLRDFADSVGHIVRYTREYCYMTLGSISQLGDTLYEMPDAARNLWVALTGDSVGITSHAWRHMISLCVRNIVKNCPSHLMQPFMVEFLPPILNKLDEVLCSKWAQIMQEGVKMHEGNEDDDLSEEMMDEHLLRQLTAVVDRLLIDLAGQHGKQHKDRGTNEHALHVVLVQEKAILAPFLKLCCNVLTFRDVRCSFNCALVLRNIVPQILLKDSEVDQFLCETMLPTGINVLSDSYFNDVHNEVGYFVTTIYTVLRQNSDRPLHVLQSELPHVPEQDIAEFEQRLTSSNKTTRQQRAVFLDFLYRKQGTVADDGKDARERAVMKAEKKNDKNKWMNKKNTNGDLMEDEGLDQSTMTNLFGDS